ncbi:MAG TPA: ABC transporter substrate-binding protein [Thermoanaerobaculia bacterium]
MIRRVAVALSLIVMLVAPLAQAARRRAVVPSSYEVIRVGALFSLTGDGSSLGTASVAALELAIRDVNRELDALQMPYHVVSDIEDTQLTATVALEKIKALHARGARIVIGPQSSSEAAMVLPYANEHGIVVISQGSTASSLAIADDVLFRLAPNDKLEGEAQAALLRADGIDTLVPMWRADAGNGGLRDSTKRSFEAAGGTVRAGVSYAPDTTNFTNLVTALGTEVRAAKNANPSAHIAVYLASFEEAVSIFRLAALDADLSSIRWYGADGVAQSRALIVDAESAAFGVKTSFTAPTVGLDEAAREGWQPISDEIREKIGFAPDAFALSVYDATWVAILSAAQVDNDASLLRDSFARNIQRYWGLTGPTILDAAGDRKKASFDFWTIRAGTATDWVHTTQYSGGHISR